MLRVLPIYLIGNSVAKERWDAIENAWGLKQTGVLKEEEWITKIDGEAQGITSSTRPSFLTPQDAGGARDRGKQARDRAAQGVLGGNIINAFARGSGKPIERTRGGVTEHVSGITFPPPAPERRIPCPHCPMTFVNEQGLGIHVKTQHSNANMSNGLRLQRMLGKTPKGYVQPWEEAGPGRCWHVKVDGATGAASFVLQRKRFRDLDLESDGFTDRKVKETRGAVKRKRYDSDLFKEEQLTPLQYLEDRLKVNFSLIVKWAQDEANIVQSAADDVKKTLLAKQQPKRWFPEEEKKLYNMFLARRRRKLKVSTLWLTVTFRKLVQENHPEDQNGRGGSARPSGGHENGQRGISCPNGAGATSRTSLLKSAYQRSSASTGGFASSCKSRYGTGHPRHRTCRRCRRSRRETPEIPSTVNSSSGKVRMWIKCLCHS
ncbi:unnamed protein product [Ectocarpus sp. CCAP 1310/34]|nr:unnamed protein product [Ectocarpus sp. CCAP 1310/34]